MSYKRAKEVVSNSALGHQNREDLSGGGRGTSAGVNRNFVRGRLSRSAAMNPAPAPGPSPRRPRPRPPPSGASGSSLFGRSLAATALTKTPPFHNVGVQRSTPHFTDRYPYVRYSYGNTDTSAGIMTQSESVYSRHAGVRDLGTKRWLEGKLNSYNTGLFTRPDYRSRVETPITPARSYIRYMPVDDAVDMYKKRCMTVGTLSKYWLSPATWASRREKELNLSSSLSRGNYSYSNRFDRMGGRF